MFLTSPISQRLFFWNGNPCNPTMNSPHMVFNFKCAFAKCGECSGVFASHILLFKDEATQKFCSGLNKLNWVLKIIKQMLVINLINVLKCLES